MTRTTDTQLPLSLTPYRWTIDRYHQAVGANIFEGQPIELLDGVLFEMSPVCFPNVKIVVASLLN